MKKKLSEEERKKRKRTRDREYQISRYWNDPIFRQKKMEASRRNHANQRSYNRFLRLLNLVSRLTKINAPLLETLKNNPPTEKSEA